MNDHVTFTECLRHCVSNKDLVREYDRLRGTNLSFAGDPLSIAIDKACGRQEREFGEFAEFVFECIWMPVVGQEEQGNG